MSYNLTHGRMPLTRQQKKLQRLTARRKCACLNKATGLHPASCADEELLLVGNRKLHKVCLDEAVDLSVHHSVHVRRLIVGAVILDAAVVEDITPYLTSPLYLLFPASILA